jgi:hypothetical protein
MTWNYFATKHGKRKVDGVGMKIQNVHEMVIYLREKSNKYHASHPTTKKMVHKYIWEVKEGDIDRTRTFDCSTMQGRRKAHQVGSVNYHDLTQVRYRHLSCFYPCCVDGDVPIQCEQISHFHLGLSLG